MTNSDLDCTANLKMTIILRLAVTAPLPSLEFWIFSLNAGIMWQRWKWTKKQKKGSFIEIEGKGVQTGCGRSTDSKITDANESAKWFLKRQRGV